MSDLRARRVAHGISGDVLCGATKIRRSRLSRLENGYIQASPEEAKHIVQALDRLIAAKQGAEKILRKGGWTSGFMPVAKQAAMITVACLLTAVLASGQIPISVSGGGGGGATSASQLLDAKWTRTSATVETLTFPAGGTTFSSNAFRSIVTNGCTITLAAGGAAAGTKFYSYWDPFSNTLKVDVSSANFNNVTVGAGCTASNTGATGYPQDVVPLGTLAAGDNVVDQWNTSPLTDTRSVYNVSPYKVGSFLTRVYTPATGVQTVALDTTKLSNPSGTTLMTGSGAFTNGDIAKFNASGDIVDGGASSGATPNGFYLQNGSNYYTGATFQLATLPSAGNYTWYNQGSSTETASGNALVLNVPLNATLQVSGRKATYTGVKTLTAALSVLTPDVSTANSSGCGIGFTDGTILYLVEYGLDSTNNARLQLEKWTNSTTFGSAVQKTHPGYFGGAGVIWLRVKDDGANLLTYVSTDGSNFTQWSTATYAGAGFAGAPGNFIYSCSTSTVYAGTATLLSWNVQ